MRNSGRTWRGKPVHTERDPASRTVFNVFSDAGEFMGWLHHVGDGWRWQVGWANQHGPAGYGEPTREAALDAMLARMTP